MYTEDIKSYLERTLILGERLARAFERIAVALEMRPIQWNNPSIYNPPPFAPQSNTFPIPVPYTSPNTSGTVTPNLAMTQADGQGDDSGLRGD